MIIGTVPLCSLDLGLCGDHRDSIFSVNYRLAPEHAHPTLVEDTYAGLVWLTEPVKDFNVDPKRIAVMGESAEEGIAAGVAVMARDRKLDPPLAEQILVCPMLDNRNTKPDAELAAFAFWSYDDNITGWGAVLREDRGKDVSPYAAAARVESMVGLPPNYIEVETLDILRDEDIAYAARLAAANITIELHVYPGVSRAFEALAPNILLRKQSMRRF
jgi:acetyl esterase/lipase